MSRLWLEEVVIDDVKTDETDRQQEDSIFTAGDALCWIDGRHETCPAVGPLSRRDDGRADTELVRL